MLSVLAVVLPVFGLIAAGFGARSVGLVGDRTGDGLSDFVFAVAVPALIFRTLSGAALPDVQPWGYWLSYFGGVAAVWTAATLAARRLFGLGPLDAVVAGFSAGQANTVLVGIPLILHAFGEAGAVPLFLLIAIHLPITMSVATLLAEGRNARPLAVLRSLAHNPLLIAIGVSVLVRWAGVPVPTALKAVIDALGGAASPCALFAMGVALRRYGLGGEPALVALVAGLKLLVHPLVVFLLATRVFPVPPVWAGVAVLFAAMPSGVNAYLFAARYGAAVPLASSAIAVSTGLSIVTTALWLAVLGVGR